MNRWFKWSLILLVGMPTCAMANDSVARVGVGGLELEKTDSIQMVSEVLEISTSKVKVTYHFLNTSDHDLKTTVAFPMPAFNSDARYSEDGRNQRPVDSLRIHAEGQLVPVQKSAVFLVDGKNVTSELRKIGLSDKQIFDPQFTCIDMALGLQDSENCVLAPKQVSAIKSIPGNNWRIKETAYWEQVFPARKEIELVQEYKPFIGVNFVFDSENKAACLDQETRSVIAKRQENDPASAVTTLSVEYILGTGRNWKGPIKNFRLIIKKSAPDEVVSLCFPGRPKRLGGAAIEFAQGDYVPQDRLAVFFYDFHYAGAND